VETAKSYTNNQEEYWILKGSLDLIEYYQIFRRGRPCQEKGIAERIIMGCFPYEKTKVNSMTRLKATIFINN
jgi:hypothetical protein